MESTDLGHDIWVYRDAIDADLCSRIAELYDQTPTKDPSGTRYDKRECRFLLVAEHLSWCGIDQEISEVVRRVLTQHYTAYNQLHSFSDEGYEICCYEPGEVAREHFDGTSGPNGKSRIWSMVVYLNEFAGGELVLPRQRVSIKPEPGMAVVWPPHMTHPHRTLPSPDRRFIMVTWSSQDQSS